MTQEQSNQDQIQEPTIETTTKKPKKESYTQFDNEFEEVKFAFKHVDDALSLRKANQYLQVLKTKVGDDEKKKLKVLQWELSRKLIKENSWEMSELNRLEGEACKQKALYKARIHSGGWVTKIGNTYPIKSFFNEENQKDYYTIFVDEIKEGTDQIDSKLAWKILNGFMAQLEDYAPDKTIWRRYTLNETEFKKYFTIVD